MIFRREFRAVPIREGRQYRAKRQRRQAAVRLRSRWNALALLTGAAGVGIFVGLLTIPNMEAGSAGVAFLREAAQQQGLLDAQGKASWKYYQYCHDAREAGVAPLYRGEGGYRPELDADGDGVACEPFY